MGIYQMEEKKCDNITDALKQVLKTANSASSPPTVTIPSTRSSSLLLPSRTRSPSSRWTLAKTSVNGSDKPNTISRVTPERSEDALPSPFWTTEPNLPTSTTSRPTSRRTDSDESVSQHLKFY